MSTFSSFSSANLKKLMPEMPAPSIAIRILFLVPKFSSRIVTSPPFCPFTVWEPLAALYHPWLLHDHLEEVAALELAHPEAHKLRAGIIAAFANDHHHSPEPSEQSEKLRADLAAGGFSQSLQRVELAITTAAVWGAKPDAAREDVLSTWHQLVSLHRQWHSLLRELKDAELALGEEASEANLAWLKDVKARLEEVDGTEESLRAELGVREGP